MKKLRISLALLMIAAISGCTLLNFNDNINNSPNSPSSASPPQLIANAMLSLSGLYESPTGVYRAQYLAQTTYPSYTLYQEGGSSFYGWYDGPLINLQTAIEKAQTANQAAVAKILKAYYFWNLTDRWGDIPYSDALKGNSDFTPKYDAQKTIYDSLFVSLKDAAGKIDPEGTLQKDIIYNGQMEKWQKLANTIRMLMALRLSEVDPQRGKQEFNAALNDGIMTSNDDNFIFQNLAEANNQNYWYGQVVDPPIREWWALSAGLMGLMKPVDDPRLPVYGKKAQKGGGYVGLKYGTEDKDKLGTEKYSLMGSAIYAQDAPDYLVTYAEALFAKAEAAERGWISEDPETDYNKAIENSIKQWTGSTEDVADFLNKPAIKYNPSNGLEQIINQRYVHLYMHGYEAWAVYRRTGYPDIMEHPRGKDVPLRQSYTSDEKLNNTENYNEAIKRQFGAGNNSIYGRLWWDVE